MKNFINNFLEKIKGWKSIGSLVFIIFALVKYYIWKDIDYPTLMLMLGIGGTTGVYAIIAHFIEWLESLKKEKHEPNPPQGNR